MSDGGETTLFGFHVHILNEHVFLSAFLLSNVRRQTQAVVSFFLMDNCCYDP